MFILLQGNYFLLACLTFFVIHSVHGQDENQNASSFMNNQKVSNDLEQNAASWFGSRVHPNLTNREFTAVVSEGSRPVDENSIGRNSIYGNNLEYGPRMTTLKQNQETISKIPFSRISNRKKVKRIRKMKTALQNVRKNISSTFHSIDGQLRNVGFSSGNTVRVNSQSKEYSGMNKISNVPHIPKELRSNQETPVKRNRVLTNTLKTIATRKGVIDSKGNLPSNSLNVNDPVKILYKHSGNETSIPCSCSWSKEKCGCICNDSLIYDDFQELSKAFRTCSNFSFAITGGQHFSLPPNLFSQIGQVQNIHLKITNSTFDYLFDATPYTSAFRGVSFEGTALIELLGVRVRRGWNWTPLEYLNSSSGAGVEIKLQGCGLRRLSSDFGKVADGKVRTASISDSRLEMIGSGAFSSFNDLTHFMLPRNRLRSIKRTDLPMEPLNLEEIDLRNNQLQSLEADLFTEMPSLQTISLAGNPLRVLPEATFSSVIGRASVQGLSGNISF
ncbi:hypothetical protein AVEN_212697-1 [Araneus ventricosus]|uniref:Uncharacterized protein n=1 Tax=Araneus ventricosus TaxID=182803 RepID=A0A4Y2QJ27_ARAVE|nr:hypothetical protein AVEN_212697-1 [Araneus ventricosus]